MEQLVGKTSTEKKYFWALQSYSCFCEGSLFEGEVRGSRSGVGKYISISEHPIQRGIRKIVLAPNSWKWHQIPGKVTKPLKKVPLTPKNRNEGPKKIISQIPSGNGLFAKI